MPTYVYECGKCGDEFELWQSFADEALKKHSGCGGKVTKVLQPVGILLKGPGFYRTDSRNAGTNGAHKGEEGKTDRGEKSDTSSNGESSSGGPPSGSSTSTTDSKRDKKSDKKTEKKSDGPKQTSPSTGKSA
ncbi:MAG TPA: FmdB family zinc ribbon protein [Acidimicrobiia bacterium]